MHIMIFKLLGGLLIASAVSIFFGALTLFVLKYVVDVFQLNYNKDAYWVFTVAFHTMIVVWILSFVFSLILMHK
jgi:hypothetical protein